ncbi:hypothetical protein B2J93_5311 [Marssonina coronariae]|uniref:Uncharacterized protein n=1 Tax=Diplocarpon coronariae TaxID=2795749 RepID=A0A218ZED9_9HELO|nr:hypothetical protein JHW43_004370 [Diplocarpon mali]OWP06358.1 hypothetical protein B2J93_5311 [Marssonina coronariae]
MSDITIQNITTSPKMLSMLPAYAHTYGQPHRTSPLSSSPLRNSLSPRDTNALPRTSDIETFSPTESKQHFPSTSTSTYPYTTPSTSTKNTFISPPQTRRESAYSKRKAKPNPLMSGRANGAEGRDTRRKLFLKRVREDSEEKKWKGRGGDEEIMRCLWVAEERRRGERRQREAMGIDGPPEEDEEQEQTRDLDELMAEEVALSEERELEALLGTMKYEDPDHSYGFKFSNETNMLSGDMSHHTSTLPPQYQQSFETSYGSDDDEYDNIFMEFIEEQSRLSSQQQPPEYANDQDIMDTS